MHQKMNETLPAVRLPQYAVETAIRFADSIRERVRMSSPILTAACMQHGLPAELAEVCGGLLATVIDDLIAAGRLPRSDFERSKRKERVLAAAEEPACHALRIAMVASPINGRAAVAYWDAICDKYEVGKLAWLLGMETDTSFRYGKKFEKMRKSA